MPTQFGTRLLRVKVVIKSKLRHLSIIIVYLSLNKEKKLKNSKVVFRSHQARDFQTRSKNVWTS